MSLPEMLERALGRFTASLSTTYGFLVVNGVMAVGLVLSWLDLLHDDTYTLALSIVAITITNAVLVAQRRDTEAIHTKLDELVRSSDARNEVIGIEKDLALREAPGAQEPSDVQPPR